MRRITDHKIPGLNLELEILVCDEAARGRACREYDIHRASDGAELARLAFQSRPEEGCEIDGISEESLLAIVIDRLRNYQHGPYAAEHYELALDSVEAALWQLQEPEEAEHRLEQERSWK